MGSKMEQRQEEGGAGDLGDSNGDGKIDSGRGRRGVGRDSRAVSPPNSTNFSSAVRARAMTWLFVCPGASRR